MECTITFSARFNYRQGGGVELHCHSSDYQVQLVYGGSAVSYIDSTSFTIKEGDVVFIPRGSSHHFHVGNEGMKTLEVKFRTDDKETVSLLSHINTLFHDENHQLFDTLTRIVAEGQRKNLEYKTICDALLVESLVIMMRMSVGSIIAFPDELHKNAEQEKTQLPVIQAVNEYIYHHMNQHFSLQDLSDGCGYNQDYLYRTIKKEFGLSAIQYVNKLRFNQAKSLMQHTELSLSEIAWNLGFESLQYFSKFFHLQANMSPSDYCKRVRSTVRIDY